VARGISRRAFVGGGAIAVTLSAVPAVGLRSALGAVTTAGRGRAGLQARTPVAAGSAWARSRFSPFVGATFHLTDGHEDVRVVLTGIRDLTPVLRAGDQNRYVLMFAAAGQHTVADGIRRFRAVGFGEIDMFVSPAGQRSDPIRYQVIVNRL